MNLPIGIAEKLLLLSNGEKIPSSKLRHEIIQDMISEGILYRPGKLKSTVQLVNSVQLKLYLENHFSISSLSFYIETCKRIDVTRGEMVVASSNSKLTKTRTFKGFLINSFNPVRGILNNVPITLQFTGGIFQFIYDFENFIPEEEFVIIGIENAENFRYIQEQKYLFEHMKPLFVTRYPQSQGKDVIKWLQSIPNNYLHFGDFDLAGIGIYMNEYKKHLGGKATFFIPDNVEALILAHGNKDRYDRQKINFKIDSIQEDKLLILIDVIHKYKKGLDQEILIQLESGPNKELNTSTF